MKEFVDDIKRSTAWGIGMNLGNDIYSQIKQTTIYCISGIKNVFNSSTTHNNNNNYCRYCNSNLINTNYNRICNHCNRRQ